MLSLTRRELGTAALLASSSAVLAACGSSTSSSNAAGKAAATIDVKDARGTVKVPSPAQRIAATDNRLFRTLEAWGVTLVAAPQDIIAEGCSYKTDKKILNTGSHREPNLEQFVAANPDLVFNGGRYLDHYDAIKQLVPDAAVVDTDIDKKSKDFKAELTRQITLVGKALGKDKEAQALVTQLEDAITRVKDAYNPDQKVLGVITTGGHINYAAPVKGRAVGPLYPMLGLTPSATLEGSEDHQGDDISVEAVADSNPDWIIVMDRDAAVAADEAGYQPASELIEKSEALKNVTAIREGNVIYMPNDFYLTEDIQAHVEVLTKFAEALEKKNG